jgi:DNA-binding MarR family transcriptional regulator
MHNRASHEANVLGAAAMAAEGTMRAAVERAVGLGGALPGALVTIDAYPGQSIEDLRAALGISQPGTVRLVNRLEREGWAERRPGRGRAVALALTPAGRRVLRKLLAAREEALAELLSPLEPSERRALTGALERILASQTHDRVALEHLCRLCRRSACGDRCPVAMALG